MNIYQPSWENRLVKLRSVRKDHRERDGRSWLRKHSTYWRQQVSSKPEEGAVLCLCAHVLLMFVKLSRPRKYRDKELKQRIHRGTNIFGQKGKTAVSLATN